MIIFVAVIIYVILALIPLYLENFKWYYRYKGDQGTYYKWKWKKKEHYIYIAGPWTDFYFQHYTKDSYKDYSPQTNYYKTVKAIDEKKSKPLVARELMNKNKGEV
jgi:hypothetical protein